MFLPHKVTEQSTQRTAMWKCPFESTHFPLFNSWAELNNKQLPDGNTVFLYTRANTGPSIILCGNKHSYNIQKFTPQLMNRKGKIKSIYLWA